MELRAYALIERGTIMTMALGGTFYDFGRVAEKHVSRGRPKVAFARTVLGHLLDGLGTFVLKRLNRSLERDVVRMRGLRASIQPVFDGCPDELDPDQSCVRWLQVLEQKVLQLHGEALQAKNDLRLKKTHVAVCRTSELCGQLHEAIVELRVAIAEHDADLQTKEGRVGDTYAAENVERMLEDLKKA